MLALYLLAAHLVGDFVLQTRWQAAGKFGDGSLGGLRMRHVTAYCVPFVPIAVWLAPDPWRAAGFMAGLWGLHLLTDSRRFLSTLGDCLAWYGMPKDERLGRVTLADPRIVREGMRVRITTTEQNGRALYEEGGDLVVLLDLPPNPWMPISILIDQTLHVCQLALLGGLFLS